LTFVKCSSKAKILVWAHMLYSGFCLNFQAWLVHWTFYSHARADGGRTLMARHHDLKPENILVFSDGMGDAKRFIIADFGSSVLGPIAKLGDSPHTGGSGSGIPACRGPETIIGRAYDIWSLGCIMLEVTA
jgi:serine/threonine protein kinase